jgi:hypothetical protein
LFFTLCVQGFWSYNYNYWSGGSKDETSDPKWCPFNDSKPNNDVLKWELDKKDMFNCMKMRILNKKAATPLQMVWSFKNCTTMSLLACKV